MSAITLRELNGFDQTPASLAHSTLLMIDYQNTYTRGVMELTAWEPALKSAAALLAQARSQGAREQKSFMSSTMAALERLMTFAQRLDKFMPA